MDDFTSQLNPGQMQDPDTFMDNAADGVLGTFQNLMEKLQSASSEEDRMEATKTPTATTQVKRQVKCLPFKAQVVWYAHVDTEHFDEGNMHICHVWLVENDDPSMGVYMGQWMSPNRQRTNALELIRDSVAQACLDPMGGLFSPMKGTVFQAKGTLKTPFSPQRPAKVLLDSEGILEYLKQELQVDMGIAELGVASPALLEAASRGDQRSSMTNLDLPQHQNMDDIRQFAAASLLATDYVSEERAPFRGWQIPHDCQDLPRHWFIRPPVNQNSYKTTDLWGWRINLERAVKSGDLERANRIVEEHQHEKDEVREYLEMRIVLTKVAEKGQTSNCRFLLDKCGVSIDGMQTSNPPSHWRAVQLDAGGLGATSPLHRAAWSGRADTIQFLLDRGASVHVTDEKMEGTPLHHALSQGHSDCVRILCEHDSSQHTYKTPKDGLDAMRLSECFARTSSQQQAMQTNVQRVLREFDQRCSNCFENDGRYKCPCQKERYCSKSCQKRRWKEHKAQCTCVVKDSPSS